MMRYIYPNRNPQVKQKTHPVIFVAAMSLILFSFAGAASALGYKPFTQVDLPNTNASNGCNLMGKKGSSVSGTNPTGKSSLELNMPSLETGNSADLFNAPLIRA